MMNTYGGGAPYGAPRNGYCRQSRAGARVAAPHGAPEPQSHALCENTTSRYGISGLPVGATYAPLQKFEDIYDPERALERGTVFAALDLPLAHSSGKGACRRG